MEDRMSLVLTVEDIGNIKYWKCSPTLFLNFFPGLFQDIFKTFSAATVQVKLTQLGLGNIQRSYFETDLILYLYRYIGICAKTVVFHNATCFPLFAMQHN